MGYVALVGLVAAAQRLESNGPVGLVKIAAIAFLVIAAFGFLPLRRWGIVPVVIASGVSVMVWASLANTTPVSDFAVFHDLAERLADGSLEALWLSKLSPTVMVYGLVFSLFGNSPLVAWIVGALLHVAQTYLVYRVALEIPAFRRSAVHAAAVFGLLPGLVTYAPVMSS